MDRKTNAAVFIRLALERFTKLLCSIGLHDFKTSQEGGVHGYSNWVKVKRCRRCEKEVRD